MRNPFLLLVTLIALLTLIGCGGGAGPDGSGLADRSGVLTGEWRGTFESSFPFRGSGTVAAELWHGSSGTLEGTLSLTGSPCLSTGAISGTASENETAFGAVSGPDEVTFDASYTADEIAGRYSVAHGDCAGDTGTFRLTRAPT